MEKIDISAFTILELEELVLSLGEKTFRAKQIFSWIHEKKATSFDEMTNLSKEFILKLSQKFKISFIKIKKKLVSSVDNTVKYLCELYDGETLEIVKMKHNYGISLCISTQVGCKMGCDFCASTQGGFVRNLSAGEMLEQVYEAERESGENIGTLVIMGIGEPFDNYDELVKFLAIIRDQDGRRLSMRNVTVSTCGIAPKIYELADLRLGLTLALSLHAPNDELRKITMPITKKYSIDELITACDYFSQKTGRRITYEYALINGFNDKEKHAKELAARLRGKLCHVNLIPINKIIEKNWQPAEKKNSNVFLKILTDAGIAASIRKNMGSDISAACGQLRSEEKKV